MRVDDDGSSAVAPAAEGFALGSAVADMYTDLRVGTLLRRLLAHSHELLHTVAGSISLVDTAHGRYDKIAEHGVSCRLGGSFPLDEGATGKAVARRMPVVIDDYSAVCGSHLPPGHPVGRGAAAAVPLWWRGEVIGVNVAFAGRRRRFTTAPCSRSRPASDGSAAPAVTRREIEVLRLLTDGLSDRKIGAHLGISAKTVEKHVGAVLRKTGTASRTAAVVHALGRGWLADVRDVGTSAHR